MDLKARDWFKFNGNMTTMKKILAYALVAVLLGVVTMLAPFALFVSEIDTSKMGTNEMDTQAEPFYSSPTEYLQRMPSKTEQTYGITPATYSPDFLFIAFMLTLSLVIALGVTSYFKRKTFGTSLP